MQVTQVGAAKYSVGRKFENTGLPREHLLKRRLVDCLLGSCYIVSLWLAGILIYATIVTTIPGYVLILQETASWVFFCLKYISTPPLRN